MNTMEHLKNFGLNVTYVSYKKIIEQKKKDGTFKIARNYVDPRLLYNNRERYIHYWTKIHKFESIHDFIDKVCVYDKYTDKVVVPIVFKDKFNSLIKELATVSKPSFKRIVDYSVLYVEDDLGSYEPTEEELNYVPPKIKQEKKKKFNYSLFDKLVNMCKNVNTDIKLKYTRDIKLLSRLRDLIWIKKYFRSSNDVKYNMIEMKTLELNSIYKNVPQMSDEQAAQGEKLCPTLDSKGNVLLETQRGESEGKPAVTVTNKLYNKLASAESSPDYGNLTDRYFPHKVYTWRGASEHPRQHVIARLTLPLDFIVEHPNSPNCVLFNNYGYWDGDIEVKILVNSNKFQVGQLQMSWYYGQDYEKNFDRRDNVYTASQQAHCLVSASTSNEGTLYIPFRYYKPKMGTKSRVDDPSHLNMGNLSVRVINPLSCPSTTYSSCTFTLSFRFINSNFSGMIARDLGKVANEPQMFAARKLLDLLDDPNRDNPPAIAPPRPMIPWSAHSWAAGDKIVEPINPMRLVAPGQTPHPKEVTPDFDEMKVDYVKRIFGLMFIKKWNASAHAGDLIFDMDGAPLQHIDAYYKQVFDGTSACVYPPIAVLSNLFSYWRGSIELRLDVISSPFHTGRILVAYIPRVIENPTLEQAKCSPHAVFDLQGESRQFSFLVPFISDRPWWQTGSFGNSINPPSRIYCFVLNELVPMDSVVNEVEINVYIRGGEDFEVSIPTSPRIGLSTYNASVKEPSTELASTRHGYTPIYTGDWRYFDGSKKIILRYKEVSDNIVQFNNLKRHTVYVIDDVANGQKIRGKGDKLVWYIVGVPIDATDKECIYATFFDDLTKATNYAKTEDVKYVEDYVSPSGWFDTVDGIPWDRTMYFKPVEIKDFELIPNMDERSSVTTACEASLLPSVPTTDSGLVTFGERFNDLKTLCRRYQIYTRVKKTAVGSKDYMQEIKIPLLPQGLVRTKDEIINNDFYNMCREGMIPIIASAYRFYRGGLRFRLVWKSLWDCSIRLEHRCDERLDDMTTSVKKDHRGIINDGYAFMIQNTKVNNVLEFEIPFYQCGILGLLQNPKIENNLESYHFSLGNLYINMYCPIEKEIDFELYYALADDCRFSVFQGFPPMISAPNHLVNEPQMGFFSDIRDTVSNSKKITEVVSVMLPEKKEGEIPMTPEEAKFSLINWITCNVPDRFKAMMLSAITQLVHCFINPTTKTIVWSISSFFMSIGVLASDMLMTFAKYMKELVRSLFKRRPNETRSMDSEECVNVPQMSEEQKDANAVKAGLISTMVASIGCILGNIRNLPKTIPDFMKGMWNGMGKFTFTANHLCTFFKNNLMWITDCYRWVLSKILPKKAIAAEIDGMDNIVKEFVEEALVLMDAKNARRIEIHPRWNLRVYACAATANLLYLRLTSVKNGPKSPALFNLMRNVIKKRDELVKFQLSPPVRFEPYVVNIFGKSNIGKSHLCQEIGKSLLKRIDYKTFEELIYTRTPGNPYWNQLRSQPICLFDDFNAIGGEFGLQQAAELFCLKSRAVFNPPQAAIEDKHIRYNPLLVFLASNSGFYKIPGVSNTEAFHRRRDMLIEAVPNEKFYLDNKVDIQKGSPKDFCVKKIKNFEHLLFKVADDVKNEETQFSVTMNYMELVDVLTNRFKVFYEREMELYKKALNEAFEFYPDDDEIYTIKGALEEQQKKLDNINSYRFGSINELKTFIMSYVGELSSIKETNEDKYKSLIPALRILYAYDRVTTKQIVLNCDILEKICSHMLLFGFTDIQQPSTSSEVKHVNIPNMGDDKIKTCNHMLFNDEFYFEREKESDLTSKGWFRSPSEVFECSELPCGAECKWSDRGNFEYDMCKWRNRTDILERVEFFKNKDLANLPTFFHKDIEEVSKISADKKFVTEKVESEIKTWSEWASHTLSKLGNGLWLVFKWTAKILTIVAGVFGIIGLARTALFPERKDIKMAKTLVRDGTYYDIALQQNKAYYDAEKNEIPVVDIMNEKLQNTLQQAQMEASGDYKTYGKDKDKNKLKEVAVTLIANLAPENEQNLYRKIRRNTCFIRAHYGLKETTARCLGIGDHVAICVDHYHEKFLKLRKLHSDLKFTLIYYGVNMEIPINYFEDIKYKRFNNSSLGFYVFPKSLQPFRGFMNEVATAKVHANLSYNAKLITVGTDWTLETSDQYISVLRGMVIDGDMEFDPFEIKHGYKYSKGGRGLCGSVLMSNTLNERPVIGIHVAGCSSGTVGYAEAITHEQMLLLKDYCKIQDVAEPNLAEVDRAVQTDAPEGTMQLLGNMPFPFKAMAARKSRVVPTECNGKIFPVYCEPPVLYRHDPRIANAPFNPLLASVNKHGTSVADFPMEYVDRAVEDLNAKVLSQVSPIRGRAGKLSKQTAIFGDTCIKGFESLDLSTSEGFPYVTFRDRIQSSGKRWLIDYNEDDRGNRTLNKLDPMVCQILKVKKRQRLEGKLPFTVFVDCLKDHKMPKEKVLIPGKTRVFSISPLDFTIQCRQYMMDFTVSYQETRFNIEHAIGIDVNSYEWTDMAHRLLNNGTNIITADYSNFGPSLNAICAIKAFEIIRNWYKKYNDDCEYGDKMREFLGYESVYSVHLCGTFVYRTMCGLPSGSPMTVIQNSLVNCIYLRVAWLIIFSNNMNFKTVTNDLRDFQDNVVFFVYGDDVIASVSDEFKDKYNCETIAHTLKQFNIEIKNATKEDTIIKYFRLLDRETSFLKHSFRPHPYRFGLLCASLDKKSVEDTLNWTYDYWQCKLREISIEACEATLRNSFGHGPDYFNFVRDSISRYWIDERVHRSWITWDVIDYQNYG